MITEKQQEIIRNYYQIVPNNELARMANVSVVTVRNYAHKWGLSEKITREGKNRAWTTEELNFLVAVGKSLSSKELANRLGRTENAITTKMSKLHLNQKMGRRPVTLPPAQMQWLIDNYPYRTNTEVARQLGVKVTTVRLLAKRLGLAKWRIFKMKPTQKKDQ